MSVLVINYKTLQYIYNFIFVPYGLIDVPLQREIKGIPKFFNIVKNTLLLPLLRMDS